MGEEGVMNNWARGIGAALAAVCTFYFVFYVVGGALLLTSVPMFGALVPAALAGGAVGRLSG